MALNYQEIEIFYKNVLDDVSFLERLLISAQEKAVELIDGTPNSKDTYQAKIISTAESVLNVTSFDVRKNTTLNKLLRIAILKFSTNMNSIPELDNITDQQLSTNILSVLETLAKIHADEK